MGATSTTQFAPDVLLESKFRWYWQLSFVRLESSPSRPSVWPFDLGSEELSRPNSDQGAVQTRDGRAAQWL